MAWIESHQELANHPKTKRLCRILNISTPQAIGHLHLLWWWALDYAQDGDLSTFSDEDIADACEWEGGPGALRDALITAGFLDGDMVHDWDQYGSKYLKRREQSRIRQQRYRDEHGRYTESSNALLTRESLGSNTVTRQDKTGQEKNVSKPTVSHPPERGVYTQEFEEKFWKPYPSTNGSKADAFKAWKQLKAEDRAAAVDALPAWLACEQWQAGYVKHAGSWLRGRLWEVPPTRARASPSNGHKPEERRPAIPTLEQVLQPAKSMSPEKLAEWREWRNSR